MRQRSRIREALLLPAVVCLLFAFASSASAALSTTSDPTVQTDGRVQAILVAGDRIYLGGYFTHVDGIERNHLAAIDATTGELTNWNPNTNGSVRTLALSDDGTRIYAGGTFTKVGTTTRNRFAAIDASTGALDTGVKGGANGTVWALAVSGNRVYLGGDFTKVKGENRTRLALVDGATGDLDANWTPTANNTVRSLTLSDDGARVYAGGAFTTVNDESRPNLTALDPTTGALDNAFLPPPPNGKVYDLKESGGRLYTAEGGPGGAAAAYDGATGTQAWVVKGNGDAEAVAVLGNFVYVGGHFERFGGQDRNKFAALDALTGALDPDWTPIGGRGADDCSAWIPSTCNAHVFELRADPQSGRLYAGGDFRRISGVSQAGFAQFSEQTPCTMTGTSSNDILEGTPADDVICGGKGNDTIKGLGGNDTLKGEGGSDKLYGGEGDDTLDGGLSTDTANFSESAAAVTASLVDNTATGEGTDTLVGIENLTGSASNDTLSGSEANNSLSGSSGPDTIDGLGGNDTLTGGGQNDTVWGGSGDDSVVGSGGADNLFGDDGDDRLDSQDGTGGNDSLDGGAHVSGDTCLVDATELSVVDCEL